MKLNIETIEFLILVAAIVAILDLYSKLKEDVTFRKKVTEEIGIGFELPADKPEVAPYCTHTELLSHVA